MMVSFLNVAFITLNDPMVMKNAPWPPRTPKYTAYNHRADHRRRLCHEDRTENATQSQVYRCLTAVFSNFAKGASSGKVVCDIEHVEAKFLAEIQKKSLKKLFSFHGVYVVLRTHRILMPKGQQGPSSAFRNP